MKIQSCKIIALLFVMMIVFSTPSQAQFGLPSQQTKSSKVAEAPSPNDQKELYRLLSDPRMIEWLRKSAIGTPENKNAGGIDTDTFRQQLGENLARTRMRVLELVSAWKYLPVAPETIVVLWQSHIGGSETLRSITYTIIFLFVGAGLEWLFWQYFSPLLLRVEFEKHASLWPRMRSAMMRASVIGSGLVVFGIGSVGAFLLFDWPSLVQRIVLNFLIAVIVFRAILAIVKFILAPRVPELRFVPLSSGPAKRLFRWTSYTAGLVVFGTLISDTFTYLATFQQSSSIATSAALAVSVLIAIAIVVLLLAAVWRISGNAKYAGAQNVNSSGRSLNLTAIFLSVLIVLSLLLWLADASEIMLSLIIIGLLIPAISIARKLINHLFDQAEGESNIANIPIGDEAPGESPIGDISEEKVAAKDVSERGRYDLHRPITVRLVRFIFVIFALVALGGAWGVSALSLTGSATPGGRIFRILVDVTVALLIADLIWVWAKTAIDRRLADFSDSIGAMGGEGGGSAGPEARMATLLPILRKILLVTIFIMVSLSVLSAMGINIAPLLAGAGVVGVAIGFGAQSLVRDIVSGIFYLLDDAFRVGEYIEMGTLRGTVESMSLRSLRVRHHRGAIHTIPFGELKSLTNYSRDWVIMKLEFRVPFDTDLKLIKKLVKQVGAELLTNEMYGQHFIQPLKSQGVRRMEEFNMVVGTKFMCTPGEQWLIRKDAYQKIRDVFEANGIELAQRNVKVEVVSDQPLTPEVKKAIAGAAQETVEPVVAATPPSDEP